MSNAPPVRLASLIAVAGLTASAAAQQVGPAEPTGPLVSLRYVGLTNRESFRFVQLGTTFTRPVGDLNMEFATGVFPSDGLETRFRSFCVEPLVPMYAGDSYPFSVDPVDRPRWFGLPDTDDGKTTASRRAQYVRELYGRFYQETLDDPKANAPAFQVALWELVTETEFPDGPMPFNLYTGTFRADYPDEAGSPAFVRQGQRYLQALTGDDAPFSAAPVLSGMELVRLTAYREAGAATVGQSQLALRASPGGTGGFVAAGGDGAPGGGLPGGVGPIAGPGGIGPAVGGGVFGGGGGGGFFGPPGGVTSTSDPGAGGPATPTPPLTTTPTPPLTEEGPISTGPVERPPTLPPITPPVTPTPPSVVPEVIPAPAAVILAGIGSLLLVGRRYVVR
jgi:hypothetical protein